MFWFFPANSTSDCVSYCSSGDGARWHHWRRNNFQRSHHWRAAEASWCVHQWGASYFLLSFCTLISLIQCLWFGKFLGSSPSNCHGRFRAGKDKISSGLKIICSFRLLWSWVHNDEFLVFRCWRSWKWSRKWRARSSSTSLALRCARKSIRSSPISSPKWEPPFFITTPFLFVNWSSSLLFSTLSMQCLQSRNLARLPICTWSKWWRCSTRPTWTLSAYQLTQPLSIGSELVFNVAVVYVGLWRESWWTMDRDILACPRRARTHTSSLWTCRSNTRKRAPFFRSKLCYDVEIGSWKETISCYSEVNSSIFYKTAAERESLVYAEREHVMNRVKKIIDLKHKMCDGTDKTFVIVNQKVRYLTSLCSIVYVLRVLWPYFSTCE